MQRFLIFLIAFFIAGCGGSKNKETTNEQPLIVTTTNIIKDALENIAGKEAQVKSIMGPGVDPHVYKATQGDLELLRKADIVFYNGLHLEGKMGSILQKFSRQKPTYALAEAVPKDALMGAPNYDYTHDPHIWFDVSLWQEAIQYASKQLQQYDTTNAEAYQTNTKDYLNNLDTLHQWISKKIKTIPKQQRVMITAHDAFAYFGEAYDIEVRGLQGISTVSEYGLKDVKNMVDFIMARKIQAVFVESSVSERALKAVVQGCREQGHQVEIGGTLYSDALGKKGTQQGTYIGTVKSNVNTIVDHLK